MSTVKHFCYILVNPKWPGKSYAGYTVSPARRVRQHNGGLVGGAKYTSRYKPDWEFLAIVTSPQFTKHTGLSFEWSLHRPTNRRMRPKNFNGIEGRLRSLPLVFNNKKFKDFEYTLYVAQTYLEQTRTLLSSFKNISLRSLDPDNLKLLTQDEDVTTALQNVSLDEPKPVSVSVPSEDRDCAH